MEGINTYHNFAAILALSAESFFIIKDWLCRTLLIFGVLLVPASVFGENYLRDSGIIAVM